MPDRNVEGEFKKLLNQFPNFCLPYYDWLFNLNGVLLFKEKQQ